MIECEMCHVLKESTEYVIDPYAQDIDNEEVWMYLCDECYQNRCDDI